MSSSQLALSKPLDFVLPPELEAGEPPEARGLARDEVRLMVSYVSSGQIVHTRFREIVNYLDEKDVLVLNTSGTLNAALPATRADGTPLELHLSTHLPSGQWTVELRLPGQKGTTPFGGAKAGEVLRLPKDGSATLEQPYTANRPLMNRELPTRLWLATLRLPEPLSPYLAESGFPIRYGYVPSAWPSSYYQTVYAGELGSAEMPSAGRAFTCKILQTLEAQGVGIGRLVLHTGVASLEDHEPPYAERYRVPWETAQLVNDARRRGRRIIAVGTTVVRALETVADDAGTVHPGEGWTNLVVTPERGLKVVDGLLTGLHEPRASHLELLGALAGRDHLKATYGEALYERYLWHEFGDLHLILP
ncbi:MAG: S-adenosylmethionine:tRNA ribosyltransferase-isomerase [Ktedonobacterales bacterium]